MAYQSGTHQNDLLCHVCVCVRVRELARGCTERLEATDTELMELKDAHASQTETLAQLQAEHASLSQQHQQVTGDLAALSAAHTALTEQHATATSTLTALQQEHERLASDLQTTSEQLVAAQTAAASAEEARIAAEVRENPSIQSSDTSVCI